MKKILFFIATLLVASSVCAQEFVRYASVDNLLFSCYDDYTAMLVYDSSYPEELHGDIVIPSVIEANGEQYTVTKIGYRAFSTIEYYNSDQFFNPNSAYYMNFRVCDITSISIPNTVTSIDASAFFTCFNLKSVTIPNSVTTIGDGAFARCTSLSSITIPNSVTNLGTGVFLGCTSLSSITIPDSFTSIGVATFSGCTGLTSINIPNTVKTIGSRSFYGCTGLTSIEIPNSVTSIDGWAFGNCSNLKNVTFGNSIKTIGEDAFFECTSLTAIDIPNSVTSMGGAFWGCSSLASVTLPSSVANSAGGSAFNRCENITSIYLPDDPSISWESFYLGFKKDGVYYRVLNCKEVAVIGNYYENNPFFANANGDNVSTLVSLYSGDIVIPATVTCGNTFSVVQIDERAFEESYNLNSVVIGDAVKTIGLRAFNASGLKMLKIGNGVTTIGDMAFMATFLEKVELGESVSEIESSAFYLSDDLELVINHSSLPIKKGSSAYGYVAYYADLVVDGDVTLVGDFVFNDEDNTLVAYIGSGGEVVMPETYKGNKYVVGEDAFEYGGDITTITIPDNIDMSESGLYFEKDGMDFYVLNNKEVAVEAWHGVAVVPSNVTNYGIIFSVTRLDVVSSDVTSLTIPNSVTTVDGAFSSYSCDANVYNFTSIVIPNNLNMSKSGLRFISEGIWYRVMNNKEVYVAESPCLGNDGAPDGDVVIPPTVEKYGVTFSVTGIEDKAFSESRILTSVIIPNTVTSIGNGAFCRCENLTSVTISNSVKSIGDTAFAYCSSLESLSIPNSVTSIGMGAFYGEYSLTSLTIQNPATKFGISALAHSGWNLSSLIIPDDIDMSQSGLCFEGDEANYRVLNGKEVSVAYNPNDAEIPNTVTKFGITFTVKEEPQGGSTAVSEVSNATAVTIVNSQILVNGEAPAFVVTVSGKKTANANLKAGVYFVVADGETVGISVR